MNPTHFSGLRMLKILGRFLGLGQKGTKKPLKGATAQKSESPTRFYVYAHQSLEGNVFYIGKGTGRRGLVRGRGPVWQSYGDERLKGKYKVQIIRDNLSEDDALDLQQEIMAFYGDKLINQQNMSRGLDI